MSVGRAMRRRALVYRLLGRLGWGVRRYRVARSLPHHSITASRNAAVRCGLDYRLRWVAVEGYLRLDDRGASQLGRAIVRARWARWARRRWRWRWRLQGRRTVTRHERLRFRVERVPVVVSSVASRDRVLALWVVGVDVDRKLSIGIWDADLTRSWARSRSRSLGWYWCRRSWRIGTLVVAWLPLLLGNAWGCRSKWWSHRAVRWRVARRGCRLGKLRQD